MRRQQKLDGLLSTTLYEWLHAVSEFRLYMGQLSLLLLHHFLEFEPIFGCLSHGPRKHQHRDVLESIFLRRQLDSGPRIADIKVGFLVAELALGNELAAGRERFPIVQGAVPDDDLLHAHALGVFEAVGQGAKASHAKALQIDLVKVEFSLDFGVQLVLNETLHLNALAVLEHAELGGVVGRNHDHGDAAELQLTGRPLDFAFDPREDLARAMKMVEEGIRSRGIVVGR